MILLCVTSTVIKEFREQTKYICKFDGACIDDMYIPRLLLFIKCMCTDVSIFLRTNSWRKQRLKFTEYDTM